MKRTLGKSGLAIAPLALGGNVFGSEFRLTSEWVLL